MQIPHDNLVERFGPAAQLDSVQEVARFIADHPRDEQIRIGAALYCMVNQAYAQAQSTSSFPDALALLTCVAQAKVAMDSAAWHSLELVTNTAALLLSAQRYVDEMTMPCNEWPSTMEVAEHMYGEACRLVQSIETARRGA